jgi:uncharacterized protein (DUF58 family)
VTSAPLGPPPVAAPARADGRWRAGFTPRSLALLGAGLIWIAPAWIDRRAILAAALWNGLVLALCALDLRRLPAPSRLRVRRVWGGPLALGVRQHVTLELENRGDVAVEASLIDEAAPSLRRDLPELQVVAPAGGAASATYDVEPRERGDATAGAVAIRYRSPWRLAERWAGAPLVQTARVYPDLPDARRHAMHLIRSRQIAQEKRRARLIGRGREFESLREFRPGDEPRDICWTATARRGKLVSRVYQPERSQAVWILVDAGRLLRARVARHTKLDGTVNAALALAQVALTAGDRVGLLAYGRHVQQRIAPARGPLHLRALVEALAAVRAEPGEADHAAAAGAVLAVQKRRALIVWLTDLAETAGVPDVIESASAMVPRHVVLFVVLRQPDVAALAAAPPADAPELYRVLAAQETIARREALLHGLRQRGALAIEVAPGELSGAVVDRYLTVKEQNLV